MGEKDSKADSRTENVEYNEGSSSSASSHMKNGDDIQMAVRSGSTAHVTNTAQAIDIAKDGGWEADALIKELEDELTRTGYKKGHFDLEFANPKTFTVLLVIFASMGGLLSGLDQSLISGANLFLPKDLGLDERQNSLVNSAMPLGAIAGALLISPCNEMFGRRWAILISCILYTIGGALCAGADVAHLTRQLQPGRSGPVLHDRDWHADQFRWPRGRVPGGVVLPGARVHGVPRARRALRERLALLLVPEGGRRLHQARWRRPLRHVPCGPDGPGLERVRAGRR